MPVPMPTAADEGLSRAEMSKPIRCAVFAKPSQAQKQHKQMLRYSLLGIALMAVVLLIAIALYYIHGNSVVIKHISLVAPHIVQPCLS